MVKKNSIKLTEYQDLWKKLSNDISANIHFAKLVSEEDPINSHFFWSDYSKPILKWIAVSVYAGHKLEDIIPLIMTQYYMFVSNPFIENKPQYYQLTSYKGLNDLKLDSWLKRNGKQYFVKEEKKKDKQNNDATDLLEFVDYEALLSLDSEEKELNDEELRNRESLKAAWNLLSDKDKDVLHLLVIQKIYWEDAYDELNLYISPKGGRQVMEDWSNKRKQDALANMKARAIEHLVMKFNKVKRNLK